MSTRLKYPALFELPTEEKWELVQELWDDVGGIPPSAVMTPDLKAELDRRRAEYLRDPNTAMSIEEAFAELRGRHVSDCGAGRREA